VTLFDPPSADPERAGRLFVAKRFRRQALTAPMAGRRSILVRMWPKRVGAKPGEHLKAALYLVLSVGLGFVAAFGGLKARNYAG
jgi:hypothetical protein